MKKFSLIIPVFNQERTIEADLKRITKVLSKLSVPFELIVVVDGYSDRSFDTARRLKLARTSVIGYKTNHGKGYAIRYGFSKAAGDVIGFLDAGGDLNPSVLPLMLEKMEWLDADIVIGSKRHPDSVVFYPLYRKILSFGYQQLIRIFSGLNVRDTQVGLKLYKRRVLAKVLPRLLVKRFAFDVEILAVSHHLGFTRIVESPVELSYRFSSSITNANFWKVVANMLIDTLAVFYRLRILKYYDDDKKRIWKFDPELNFKVNIG